MRTQLYILSFILFSLAKTHDAFASAQELPNLLRRMQLRAHCPLLETIRRGDVSELGTMLEGETCEFEADPFGWDPLMSAVVKHKTDMVTMLLESKHAQSFVSGRIRVSESNGASMSGWTAIHLAVQSTNPDSSSSILRYLLSKSIVDINAKTAFGETAFDIALKYNRSGPNFSAIEELLSCERFNLLETKLLTDNDPYIAYAYVQELLNSSHKFRDSERQRLEEATSELRRLVEEQRAEASEAKAVPPVQKDERNFINFLPLPKLPDFSR